MHSRPIEQSGDTNPENFRYPFRIPTLIRCREYKCATRTKSIDFRFEPAQSTGTKYNPLRMAGENKFVHGGFRLGHVRSRPS
jgi:hypothetical protein